MAKSAKIGKATSNSKSPNSKNSDSLVTDSYEWLLDAIVTFKIPTNSQISENWISGKLGISRTPIREALRKLEIEGLVTRTDQGRYIVAMLTHRDVDEALDLIELCDIYTYHRAAENISLPDLTKLKGIAKDLAVSGKKSDVERWSEIDAEYHEIIMSAANNQMVAETSRMVRRRIQRFWAKSVIGPKNLPTCSDEHLSIVQAIERKDLPAITREVTAHLTHLRDNLHEIVDATAPFFGLGRR